MRSIFLPITAARKRSRHASDVENGFDTDVTSQSTRGKPYKNIMLVQVDRSNKFFEVKHAEQIQSYILSLNLNEQLPI